MLVAVADMEIDRQTSSKTSNCEPQITGPFSNQRLRNLPGQLRNRLVWLDFTISDNDELSGAGLSNYGPARGARPARKRSGG